MARRAKPAVPEGPTYLRAYPLALGANVGKLRALSALFLPYTQLAAALRPAQIGLLFTTGRFNKNAPMTVPTPLSARYQQTCQYQVVAMLSSWLAARRYDFRQMVLRSSLSGPVRDELLLINQRKAWYRKDLGFSPTGLRLAQGLMRQLRRRHRWPNMHHINLALDAKVAKVEKATEAAHFPYWVKLSTLDAGAPVWLPLASNAYFERAEGQLKAFIQLNHSPEHGLTAALVKEFAQKPYTPRTPVLALDTGLCFLFASAEGDLLGQGCFAQLQALDRSVSACAAGRQRRGLRVRSARYDALVQRVRGLLACEWNRMLNQMIDRLAPAEIVLEALDFRDSRLSKRMNRLIRNFGRRIVKDKLTALAEEYGIVATEIPAAYSSQECPHCHHVEKKNRATRGRFRCLQCGYCRHADVVGARNIRTRRSWPEAKAGWGLLMRREAILARLRTAHQTWCAHHAAVRSRNGGRSAAVPLPDIGSPGIPSGSGQVRMK